MKPYWASDDGAIRVYHARTGPAPAPYDALPDALVDLRDELRRAALVHGDPPYGIDADTDRSGSKGGKAFPKIVGDDRPYDPGPILSLARPTVLWGANNYASRLPDSYAWFLWDKLGTLQPFDGSDAEVAWTNIGNSVRIFRHMWRGVARDSEPNTVGLGPCQKPVALCLWTYQRAKLRPGDLLFVPYLGSGPDLPAARAAGLRVIAVDVVRDYLDTAIARLGAVTPERAEAPVGPLFARAIGGAA